MTLTTKLFTYTTIGLIASAVLMTGVASAQTYYYVAADGSLKAEEANTSTQAIVTADNIKHDSGVITEEAYNRLKGETTVVVTNQVDTTYVNTSGSTTGEAYDADSETYLYVASNGELMAVRANTPDQAISVAPNIMYNSGVMVASE